MGGHCRCEKWCDMKMIENTAAVNVKLLSTFIKSIYYFFFLFFMIFRVLLFTMTRKVHIKNNRGIFIYEFAGRIDEPYASLDVVSRKYHNNDDEKRVAMGQHTP